MYVLNSLEIIELLCSGEANVFRYHRAKGFAFPLEEGYPIGQTLQVTLRLITEKICLVESKLSLLLLILRQVKIRFAVCTPRLAFLCFFDILPIQIPAAKFRRRDAMCFFEDA